MRIPTEKEALAHLRRSWKLLPVMIQSIETSTAKGVPDLYLWFHDHIIRHNGGIGWWLELKRGNSSLRPAQTTWLHQATASGLPCGILRVWPEYQFSLNTVDQTHIHRYDQTTLYRALTTTLRTSRMKPLSILLFSILMFLMAPVLAQTGAAPPEVSILDAIVGALITLGVNLVIFTLYVLVVIVLFRRWKPIQNIVAEFADELRDASVILRRELTQVKDSDTGKLSNQGLIILAVLGLVSAATLHGMFMLVAALVQA